MSDDTSVAGLRRLFIYTSKALEELQRFLEKTPSDHEIDVQVKKDPDWSSFFELDERGRRFHEEPNFKLESENE